MNNDEEWNRISRFRPLETKLETLLELSKNANWETRFNAVRELYFLKDVRALDALIDLLKNDPNDNVRRMAYRAISALHEDGIETPFYQGADNTDDKSRIEISLARLKELNIEVKSEDNAYILWIPHNLDTLEYIEIGYLMAQLGDMNFPQSYSPLASMASFVVPQREHPCIEYRESYPHGLKISVTKS